MSEFVFSQRSGCKDTDKAEETIEYVENITSTGTQSRSYEGYTGRYSILPYKEN